MGISAVHQVPGSIAIHQVPGSSGNQRLGSTWHHAHGIGHLPKSANFQHHYRTANTANTNID